MYCFHLQFPTEVTRNIYGGENDLTARGESDRASSAAAIASRIFDASGGDVNRSRSGSHSGPSAASKPTYHEVMRGLFQDVAVLFCCCVFYIQRGRGVKLVSVASPGPPAA